MASLSFRHLEKSYGSTKVLKGVDLDVADGEYLVLVGPSGCGKSTLLRCIAGLEDISSGDLLIADRRVNDVAPRDRDVAMVFQSYALYPHMTVAENMSFALRIRKQPKAVIDKAVREAAALLELEELLDRYPSQMSGGQRQRVAMGRAIVRRPSVFLFDEPLSNLDAALRTHMRVELKRLHQRLGVTVVHVTHDQVEALTLADRILVLDGGVVQQAGTPRELFDEPANRFVAGFIGSPSMNFLEAQGHGDHSTVGECRLPIAASTRWTLGVRPTDLHATSDDGHFTGVVDVIESMGSEAMVHLMLGEQSLVVRLPEPVTVRRGDTLSVRMDTWHRFDVATGARLP